MIGWLVALVYNAVADVAMIADSPAAAATTCSASPISSPATAASAALRPPVMLWLRMNSTAGPGMSRSTIVAAAKVTSAWAAGMDSTVSRRR